MSEEHLILRSLVGYFEFEVKTFYLEKSGRRSGSFELFLNSLRSSRMFRVSLRLLCTRLF